jgi:hypothetical protein
MQDLGTLGGSESGLMAFPLMGASWSASLETLQETQSCLSLDGV